MNTSSELGLDIPYYNHALFTFMRTVMHGLRVLDPLLSQIASQPTVHGGPSRNVSGAQPLDQPLFETQQIFLFPLDAVRTTNIEHFLAALTEAAIEHNGQLAQSFFRTISEICDATGNTMSAEGRPINFDLVLDMLEQTEISFNEDGSPNFSVILHPTQAEKLLASPVTAAQKRRHVEILARKRAEQDAQKRTRRLPRQGA